MKYFYLKSIIALIVIALSLSAAIKLVYIDKSGTDAIKNQNRIIRTLSKENVRITAELLDFEKHEVFDCTMENTLFLPSLAKQYLGKNAERVDDYTYYSNSGTVTFKNYQMNYTPKSPLFAATTKSLSLLNAKSIASLICAEYGILTSNAQLGVSGGNDKISVSVMFMLNSMPVFNNAFVLELSTSGLHSISGTNYAPSNARKNVRYAKPMEDALMDFMYECTDKTKETVITDIQLGYLLDDTSVQQTNISPVWRIVVENSEIYYVPA